MKKNDFEAEKILAEKASEGGVGAFEKLFAANKGRIYNYSLKMTGDVEFSKEITQDVFIRAFRNLKKLRQKEMFHLWIMKIAVNCVKDCLKKKTRYVRKMELSGTLAAECTSEQSTTRQVIYFCKGRSLCLP